MQKARRRPKAPTACKQLVSGTISLPCSGYFSPFPHGTCSLSVSQYIQPYQMVLADSHRISHVPRYSGYGPPHFNLHTGLSPAVAHLSRCFCRPRIGLCPSYNPNNAETMLVWASPRSLAATRGITIVFYSSGYLDVSVLRVCFHTSMDDYSSNNRVSPFGHLRIKMYVPLPVTFRSLSRPSSPLRAKVSPLRS